ncbi:putative uncharacterized protein [Novosphingobium sp. PY1]|nr:putative uncharacterized protein [Novosphingobium sp. PY1]
MSAYLQYEQLYRQVYDRNSANYTGFNRFSHERELAGPDYATFKVPNSDTLYSTAWIDLENGPVEVNIPPTSLKYFTLNIFDIFGNPGNLSSRTIGFKGGRFMLAPPNWKGTPPPGVTVYRSSSVRVWILMRVFAQSKRELKLARDFQDRVKIGSAPPTGQIPAPEAGAAGFLRVLDNVLRVDGCLPGEEALVSRFRILDILGTEPFDPAHLNATSLAAVEKGYREAQALIERSRSQLGSPTGTGWTKVRKGNYGFDYVRRSVTNAAGLGANVREENSSYTTFVDGTGKQLDASASDYVLQLKDPPPVNAFWSVTLYDARTFALYANPLKRYLISDRTSGLKRGADGSITIDIRHSPPEHGNWLPAPDGPFFIVIRAYSPKPEMFEGKWLPPAIKAQSRTSKASR